MDKDSKGQRKLEDSGSGLLLPLWQTQSRTVQWFVHIAHVCKSHRDRKRLKSRMGRALSCMPFLISFLSNSTYKQSRNKQTLSQKRLFINNVTCRHTKTNVSIKTCHFTRSEYADTKPTSPSADPLTPDGGWRGEGGGGGAVDCQLTRHTC